MPELLILVGLWILFVGGLFLFVRGSALGQRKGDLLWQEEVTETPWPYERRRFKRRYLPFPINYGSLDNAEVHEQTLTRDIGKGGLRFPTTYFLKEGSRLFLSVDLPKGTPLSLFGEVVWQKSLSSPTARYDTGIKFVDLTPSHLKRMNRHL